MECSITNLLDAVRDGQFVKTIAAERQIAYNLNSFRNGKRIFIEAINQHFSIYRKDVIIIDGKLLRKALIKQHFSDYIWLAFVFQVIKRQVIIGEVYRQV